MGQTDARTDVYCLGATLYHLLTGHNPSDPPYEIRPIREIDPTLSSGLESIICKCTQRNPDDRYQSCAELAYALENYEKVDDEYIQKQRQKFGVFLALALSTVVFALAGVATQFSAEQLAKDNYAQLMDDAARATDYHEKIRLYTEGIQVANRAGDEKAYLELIKLIKNNQNELKKQTDNYVDVCFETGKLYCYWRRYGSSLNLTLGRYLES